MRQILSQHRHVNLVLRRHFAKQSFILPDLGEGLKDVTVLEYLVKAGQTVQPYDTVARVNTQKATVDIPSEHAGKILKFHVDVGQNCLVGAPLYDIDVQEEGGSGKVAGADGVEQAEAPKTPEPLQAPQCSAKSELRRPQPQSTEVPKEVLNTHVPRLNLDEAIKQSKTEGEVLSTPAVRKLAGDLGINLAFVKGTGPKGRVLKEDVLIFHEIVLKAASQLAGSTGHSQAPTAPQTPAAPTPAAVSSEPKSIAMTQFERGMVLSMTHAATVPHFNLHELYDINDLYNMRSKLKEAGINISLFALIVKSFSLALSENLKMNSTYYPEKDKFSFFSNAAQNVSIAIDSKFGLAAPNIKNVQCLSAEEIDREIKHLKDLTDNQRLKQEHLTGGTIALSNVGTISGYLATPLNLPGQCCIVALGKVVTEPRWNSKTNAFEPKMILPVSFGCDHRVLDGATVARFSKSWRHYIEEPYLILSKLK